MTTGPIKIAIRNDGDTIKAFMVGVDVDPTFDSHPDMVLGTLRIAIAERHPELGEKWKELMEQVLLAFLSDSGVEVKSMKTVRPLRN